MERMNAWLMGVTLLTCGASSAASAAHATVCESVAGSPPSHLVVVAIDVSGSVTAAMPHRALEDLGGAIASLAPDTRIMVRVISQSSYGTLPLLIADIPAVDPPLHPPRNPYASTAVAQYRKSVARSDAMRRCADEAKARIAQDVRRLQLPTQASGTDLRGALVAAAEAGESTRARSTVYVIYSDLKATTGWALPRDLAGFRDTTVVVRTAFQADISSQEAAWLQAQLRTMLKEQQVLALTFARLDTVALRQTLTTNEPPMLAGQRKGDER
jgi:hypothetical protein